MDFDWKNLLRQVAPAIGAAIGGPFGAVAGQAVKVALGLGADGDEDALSKALERATPEQLLALKAAEQRFKLDMQKLGVDVLKLDAEDRASARQREVLAKDRTPGCLACLVTLGFFGLLSWLMVSEPPTGSKEILNIMLGALGAAWASIVSYYFGSSAGSAAKSKIIAEMK